MMNGPLAINEKNNKKITQAEIKQWWLVAFLKLKCSFSENKTENRTISTRVGQ